MIIYNKRSVAGGNGKRDGKQEFNEKQSHKIFTVSRS
jgi:hypothetical protein